MLWVASWSSSSLMSLGVGEVRVRRRCGGGRARQGQANVWGGRARQGQAPARGGADGLGLGSGTAREGTVLGQATGWKGRN